MLEGRRVATRTEIDTQVGWKCRWNIRNSLAIHLIGASIVEKTSMITSVDSSILAYAENPRNKQSEEQLPRRLATNLDYEGYGGNHPLFSNATLLFPETWPYRAFKIPTDSHLTVPRQ